MDEISKKFQQDGGWLESVDRWGKVEESGLWRACVGLTVGGLELGTVMESCRFRVRGDGRRQRWQTSGAGPEGLIQRGPLPWASLHALRDRQLVWVGTQGVSPTAGSRLACHKVKWSNEDTNTDRTIKSWGEEGERGDLNKWAKSSSIVAHSQKW